MLITWHVACTVAANAVTVVAIVATAAIVVVVYKPVIISSLSGYITNYLKRTLHQQHSRSGADLFINFKI